MEFSRQSLRSRDYRATSKRMEEVKRLVNFIDGQFIECSRHIDSYNPATGKQILKIPDSGSEEVDAAVQAAKKAFKLYVFLSVQ